MCRLVQTITSVLFAAGTAIALLIGVRKTYVIYQVMNVVYLWLGLLQSESLWAGMPGTSPETEKRRRSADGVMDNR